MGKRGVAGKTEQGSNAGGIFGTVRPDRGSNWSRDQNRSRQLFYHETKDDFFAFYLDNPNGKDQGWLRRPEASSLKERIKMYPRLHQPGALETPNINPGSCKGVSRGNR